MSLKVASMLPTLDGATEWLNGEAHHEELVNSPLLIQFWAVSCPVCKRNMPSVQAWKEMYGPLGVQFVSVHMPRMSGDTDVEKVRTAIRELGVTEPCAIDNEHKIGDRFQTSGYWPYYFLFDSAGAMRCHAPGPMGLRLAENALKRLLGLQQTQEGAEV